MELPARAKGDQLLRCGEQTDIRRRLRVLASRHELTTVIACAFDHRTRMLPFFWTDLRMVPAGVRAIGSALVDSGFPQTRIVLQQWNRNFRPAQMRLDGRVPDLFLISSMSLHTAACKAMLRDVHQIAPDQRPLIIAGGSLGIYEPWEAFGAGADGAGADLAVTGEEYVLLHLLETLLSGRNGDEPLRRTFAAARDSGALDTVPGLVYPHVDSDGHPVELVHTGTQRLLGDLDELAFPTAGYRLLEPPGRHAGLASRPLEPQQVRKYSPVASLVITFGCRFACEYCPIPAYNQRHLRGKSGARVAEELDRLNREFGIRYFFGTDDNFLSDPQRALAIIEAINASGRDGVRLGKRVRWGTEATVHDTLKMRQHLPALRSAGVRGLWLGVEDMTGSLVRKGQSEDKTIEAFRLLRQHGICPMPMLIHHDAQPLLTLKQDSSAGLLNQVRLLRRAGAVSLQVLMLTPSAGSKLYEETFTSGMVYASVAGKTVQPHQYDGNFVVASASRRPWQKQLNLTVAYLYFYNPLRLLVHLIHHRGPLGIRPAAMQLVGMWGLLHTIRRTSGWALRLLLGNTTRQLQPPSSPLPLRRTPNRVADLVGAR